MLVDRDIGGIVRYRYIYMGDKFIERNVTLNNKLLFLDVATSHTGYSIYEPTELGRYALVQYGNVNVTKGEIHERVPVMAHWIGKLMGGVAVLVQEFPSFQSSAKGKNAAMSGSTLQMARLCGLIEGRWDMHLAFVYMNSGEKKTLLAPCVNVTFNSWNGQVPKHITCARLKSTFGIEAKPGSVEDNWADAIMMGKWYITTILKGELFHCIGVEQRDINSPSDHADSLPAP